MTLAEALLRAGPMQLAQSGLGSSHSDAIVVDTAHDFAIWSFVSDCRPGHHSSFLMRTLARAAYP